MKEDITRQLVSSTMKEVLAKLQERYSLSRGQIYKRLNYLGIKSYKTIDGVWLDSEQLKAMDELHEHLKAGNPQSSYKANGDWLIKEQQQQESSLVNTTTTITQGTPIETIASQQVQASPEAVAAIHRAAQTKAAGNLILQNLLVGQYLNNPNLLDPDLKAAISQSEVMASPKEVNPMIYAQELLRCSPIYATT